MKHQSPTSLARFKGAQGRADDGYATALDELNTTGKRSHWIWYIFPQLAGLGSSPDARYYALTDTAEAAAFLHDPILGLRLLAVTQAVASKVREGASIEHLMNSTIDVQKLVSCLTLFQAIAQHSHRAASNETALQLAETASEILAAAAAQGFPLCGYTLRQLATVH